VKWGGWSSGDSYRDVQEVLYIFYLMLKINKINDVVIGELIFFSLKRRK
jgi:hypothetical protein